MKKELVDISLSQEDIGNYGLALSTFLKENNYALDEIVLCVTNTKTNDTKKIKLIKNFSEFIIKLDKELKKDSTGKLKDRLKKYLRRKYK